jgi:hypothetical protein
MMKVLASAVANRYNCNSVQTPDDQVTQRRFTCRQFHQHSYVQIFCTNVASAAFSSYVFALAQNSYKKHAHKTLMKLTPGKRNEFIMSTRYLK